MFCQALKQVNIPLTPPVNIQDMVMTRALLTALQISFGGIICFCNNPIIPTTHAHSKTFVDITDSVEFNV